MSCGATGWLKFFVAARPSAPHFPCRSHPLNAEETRRVKIMNANWIAGADRDDGDFELMIVTRDEGLHVVAPSPSAAMSDFVLQRGADG
jgi:hypothetical protein